MQLIKRGSVEGVWFEFKQDGAPEDEKSARFLIRRIPTAFDKENFRQHFGFKAEVRRKNGAVISDLDYAKRIAHTLDLAIYALLNSEDAEVPSVIVPTMKADESGMVKLDGQWSEDVKRLVLGEVPSLATWIVARANTLTAQAVDEEEAKGKTS